MSAISINIALARMEQTVVDGEPVTFSIEFIKEDGSIRKMRAQKHVKLPGASGAGGSKFKYRLKNKHAVLLFDTEIEKYRTVLIDRITKFNEMEVKH